MTVGIIGHYLGAKMGIGVFIDRLLDPLMEEMTRQGLDVKVICSPNALAQTPALERLKARSPRQVCVLPPLDYSPIKRFSWVATQMEHYCQQEGIDQVVWLSNPMVLPWHPPSVAVLHDVNEWKAKEKYGSWLKTTLRAWMYLEASILWAKKIVCVSQATTDDLCHFKPHVHKKVRTIPNGLDSPLSSLTPAEIETPSAPFLLSVGRIDPAGKRLPEAVSLVGALRDLSGEPWELHMAGGMNKSTQQAGEAFIQSVETVPWIYYHGYTDDASLAAWYSSATAVVFLSDNEGFGSPVAEAAAFGRRVVVNANNQATLGAGGSAVIPVNPQDPNGAAITVLSELQVSPLGIDVLQASVLQISDLEISREGGGVAIAPPKIYTYADAAVDYAAQIFQVTKAHS